MVPGGDVGRAKIIDFGIARSTQLNKEGTIIGSGFAGKHNYVSPEQIRIARWCVARGQRSLGQFEVALATQRELLIELERMGGKDGYVFEEIAENLLALNQPDEAQTYFALARRDE